MSENSKVKVDVKSDPPAEPDQDMENVEDAAETASGDANGDLEIKIEAAEAEAKVSHDRFLRVSAEFENYKKRTRREVDDFRKYANEALLKDLLSVVDNLERAVESSSEQCEHGQLLKGVDLTLKEILKVFEKFQVKPIEALEREFDPTVHQAVLQEPSDGYAENTVIREFQKGYTIHDRLLRPAMVVVSKAAAGPGDDSGTDGSDQKNES
ncbi:MAG: nucleotide exchange factor GrpE [Deltaproteobacteria bacterium]|nr:nucleotide exchange factor GrpE [Deltaproteobacteria bacterium]